MENLQFIDIITNNNTSNTPEEIQSAFVVFMRFCQEHHGGQAELFATQQEAMESELFWNPEYGKRALVEMLSSLDSMTAFLNKSGRPCSFASIVAHFEALLHIELPRPYQIRMQVLERKLKRTSFIDKMKDELVRLGDTK